MKTRELKWINVNDQLPEDRVTVIVGWIGTGDEHVTTGYYHEKTESWYPAHPAPYTIPVSHWMPIPKKIDNNE